MNNNRGVALLMVLIVVGLLSIIVVESLRRSQIEVISARNNLHSLQGQALAVSGFAAASALLVMDINTNANDSKLDIWYPGEEGSLPIPVEDKLVNIAIEDEYGKFPLGSMVDQYGKDLKNPIDAYENLLLSLGFEPNMATDLTQALVDWIDDDSLNDTYEYNPKFTVPNTPLTSLDELSRIELYKDLPADEMALILKNVSTRMDPKINVNTASAEVLSTINPGVLIPLEDYQALADTLAQTPDEMSLTSTNALIGTSGRLVTPVAESGMFKATITADVDGVNRRAECIIERDNAKKTTTLLSWAQY